MHTYGAIINLWPNAEEFARDLGISGVRARQWRARNGIPAGYWRAIIDAAERRGFEGVSLDALSRIAAEPAAVSLPVTSASERTEAA